MHILSKSTFIRGCQCKKSLYLNEYHKEFRNPILVSQERIFKQGKDVGLLARGLFPNGVDVSPRNYFDYQEAITETYNALKIGETTIYEPSFQFARALSALDILVKGNHGWKAYEVKSSTKVSDTHILDSAFQYYIIKSSGIILEDFSIIYINSNYVRGNDLELDKLFITKSILSEVENLQSFVSKEIDELTNVLKQNEIPNIEIGLQCSTPYTCDFTNYCWRKIPVYSIFDIANLRNEKKFELYRRGILNFKDIPKDYPLNEKQWEQVNCELSQKVIVNTLKIHEFLNGLKYPLHFLDFETFQLAIPKFSNSRPYQQIAFQYSLHKRENKGSDLSHEEFIADVNSEDPRISFVQNLIADCQDEGDILVYNIAFEKARLQEIAKDLSELSSLISGILNRLKDLMIPFRERWFYIPQMKGSYSIKTVLPALVPEFSYSDLEIGDGATASSIYASMVEGSFSGNISESLKALSEYCKLDTLAMVKILDKIYSLESLEDQNQFL